MVKKLFALAFVGITTTASIAGVALTNTNLTQLNAGENQLSMVFTSNEVTRYSESGFTPSFTLSTTTPVSGTEYSTNGTLSIDGDFDVQIKRNGHIFHIIDGEDVSLSLSFQFHYAANPTSIVIAGANNGYRYSKTFSKKINIKNGVAIDVDLPDLDYDKSGKTEIYIDTITLNYTC